MNYKAAHKDKTLPELISFEKSLSKNAELCGSEQHVAVLGLIREAEKHDYLESIKNEQTKVDVAKESLQVAKRRFLVSVVGLILTTLFSICALITAQANRSVAKAHSEVIADLEERVEKLERKPLPVSSKQNQP